MHYPASIDAQNLLFVNNKNSTFTERAKEFGLNDNGNSTHASFFDYDNDGDLDCYVVNSPSRNIPELTYEYLDNHFHEKTGSDKLYKNNKNVYFTDVSGLMGIKEENAFGLNVLISDINQDGWVDIFVCNDFMVSDFLYINNRNGTFTEKIRDYFQHTSHSSMGSDIADFNNDGLPDVFVLDMLPEQLSKYKTDHRPFEYDHYLNVSKHHLFQEARNTLQLNNGNGTFSEIGQLAGISNTDWSWGTLFSDFDNDGWKDIFVSNGIRKNMSNADLISHDLDSIMRAIGMNVSVSQMANKNDPAAQMQILKYLPDQVLPNYAFKNNRDLTFSNISKEWGLDEMVNSNGSAYSDLDNDGDLDLILNNADKRAYILENTQPTPNPSQKEGKSKNAATISSPSERSGGAFIRFKCVGNKNNHFGLGTKINLYAKEKTQYAELSNSRGFLSNSEPIIHFGLGTITKIDSAVVTWLGGKKQMLKNLNANQLVTVTEQPTPDPAQKAGKSTPSIFSSPLGRSGGAFVLDFIHKENYFIDFKQEPLVPHLHSQNGSGIAVGDVNGDNLDDVFIGAGSEFIGALFIQTNDEKFIRSSNNIFEQDKKSEDMGALFFDYDNDGDLDLYVVSGGNEFPENAKEYQDRLYNNDGKGNFTKTNNIIPEMKTSGSCVVAADYDKDGDMDLFVGGRVVNMKYPLAPRSYLLKNYPDASGGKFVDVTDEIAPELKNVGMVTSAIWTDFDNDNEIDLCVVGEWMPITFFKNTPPDPLSRRGKFQKISIANSGGFWNSVTGGDFDNDGDIDYVCGNLGLNTNFRLKATVDEPLTIYAKDFDNNKTMDAVICKRINNKDFPIHTYMEITDQLPFIRQKCLRYRDYARCSAEDVFSKPQLENALQFKTHTLASSYIENQGNGKFVLKPLPIQAQIAPVNGILAQDFDGDENLDLLLVGNNFGAKVDIGRYDAGTGLLLKGNGNGTFTPMTISESGFFNNKDARALSLISWTKEAKPLVVAVNNNDSISLFEFNIQSRYIGTTFNIQHLEKTDLYAIINFKNGKKRKVEFYNGEGYLSQNTRRLWVSGKSTKISFFNNKGEKRKINP